MLGPDCFQQNDSSYIGNSMKFPENFDNRPKNRRLNLSDIPDNGWTLPFDLPRDKAQLTLIIKATPLLQRQLWVLLGRLKLGPPQTPC